MITFKGQVNGVKADVAKKTVSVSFTFVMTDEALEIAKSLAFHKDKAPVSVTVTPTQMAMLLNNQAKTEGKKKAGKK